MRFAIIGRTAPLLEAARSMLARGHEIAIVWTSKAESFYGTDESMFRDLADTHEAEFICRTNINSPESVERLKNAGCHLALSANWQTILSSDVIAAFPLGMLNAHAGDLPRYRGNACPNWALLEGETNITLCIHLMSPALDAGPVVKRTRLPVDDSTYIGDIYDWLWHRIPLDMVESAEGLWNGSLEPEPQSQDEEQMLRCYPRRPEDSRIKWSEPVERIHRLIRASSHPFDGAYSSLEGERRVTVWRASRFQKYTGHFLAVPGQVCLVDDGMPVIACGSGMLRLEEISVDGAADSASGLETIYKSLRNRLI